MISSPTANKTKVPTTADSSTTTGTQARHAQLPRPSVTSSRRLSDICMEEEQPGRFERDFDEVEEIGSGEFGKVMKVKNKNVDGAFSAVKHSKRFQGAKHRYVKSYHFFGDFLGNPAYSGRSRVHFRAYHAAHVVWTALMRFRENPVSLFLCGWPVVFFSLSSREVA
jgi:hypothetical protein